MQTVPVVSPGIRYKPLDLSDRTAPGFPVDGLDSPLAEEGNSARCSTSAGSVSALASTRAEGAMVEFRRMMKWIVIGAVAMTVAAVWYLSLFTDLTVPVVAATIAGVFLSVVLGCGLFAAAFFSNNSGLDQAVGGVMQPHPERRTNPTALPDNLAPYKNTDIFSETSVPAGLLRDHSTKQGVWGLIRVIDGRLRYRITDPRRAPSETILSPGCPPGIVEPTILHHVEALGSVRFQVEFLRRSDPTAPS